MKEKIFFGYGILAAILLALTVCLPASAIAAGEIVAQDISPGSGTCLSFTAKRR